MSMFYENATLLWKLSPRVQKALVQYACGNDEKLHTALFRMNKNQLLLIYGISEKSANEIIYQRKAV